MGPLLRAGLDFERAFECVCVPALIRQMKQQVRSRRIRHQGRWQCCVSMAGAAWAPHRYTILLALPEGGNDVVKCAGVFFGYICRGGERESV